jgi:hypothetical protein
MLGKPSILLVAQPESLLDAVPEGMGHRMSRYEGHIPLSNGRRLLVCWRVSDVINSRETWNQESIADEALHLTAAMDYCGFGSVVGTL